MNFTANTYCIMPWSSIQINPSGDFKVCCFSGSNDPSEKIQKTSYDENGVVMNVLTHSIEEAMNSVIHKELRLYQSQDKRHPHCDVCWKRDDANARMNQQTNSLRNYRSFVQLRNEDNAVDMRKASLILKDDGSIDPVPISLDLRFSNLCNMKCIMCGPQYSSLWYEDHTRLYDTDTFNVGSKEYKIYQDNGVYKSDYQKWHDTPQWWDQFDRIKHSVRHIYITGGEPFLIPSHDKLLDDLISNGLADKIILEYDTNLSVYNEKIMSRLTKFRQVILSVSCDDVGDRYELIRFPGKFERLTDNLAKIQGQINIRHISTCVGIHSLFAPLRLYEFFSPLGYDKYSIRILRKPNYQDIAYLPKRIKEHVLSVYEASSAPKSSKALVIGYLLNNMNTYSDEQCVKMCQTFINNMNRLDVIRHTNWRKTFPEIADILRNM
jgi:organic radical activating enzyme